MHYMTTTVLPIFVSLCSRRIVPRLSKMLPPSAQLNYVEFEGGHSVTPRIASQVRGGGGTDAGGIPPCVVLKIQLHLPLPLAVGNCKASHRRWRLLALVARVGDQGAISAHTTAQLPLRFAP